MTNQTPDYFATAWHTDEDGHGRPATLAEVVAICGSAESQGDNGEYLVALTDEQEAELLADGYIEIYSDDDMTVVAVEMP